jgi:hypothetical protein
MGNAIIQTICFGKFQIAPRHAKPHQNVSNLGFNYGIFQRAKRCLSVNGDNESMGCFVFNHGDRLKDKLANVKSQLELFHPFAGAS